MLGATVYGISLVKKLQKGFNVKDVTELSLTSYFHSFKLSFSAAVRNNPVIVNNQFVILQLLYYYQNTIQYNNKHYKFQYFLAKNIKSISN